MRTIDDKFYDLNDASFAPAKRVHVLRLAHVTQQDHAKIVVLGYVWRMLWLTFVAANIVPIESVAGCPKS